MNFILYKIINDICILMIHVTLMYETVTTVAAAYKNHRSKV